MGEVKAGPFRISQTYSETRSRCRMTHFSPPPLSPSLSLSLSLSLSVSVSFRETFL